MLKVYKKVGQTPLEVIDEIRKDNPHLKGESMSYAGRLDPMAEGEMLILVGDEENRQRQEFLGFDKEYEADILIGCATDTYDLLGLVTQYKDANITALQQKKIRKIISDFTKKKTQVYPEFSSKTVQGRPLFEWKKSGQIDQIVVPKRKISIAKAKFLSFEKVSIRDLLSYIESHIPLVHGDFRQKEIIEYWRVIFSKMNTEHLPIARVLFRVSSGTYIRGLANELGIKLKIPSCLMKLKRTKIIM
jgi:tRNA pseudouridine(55) synthase